MFISNFHDFIVSNWTGTGGFSSTANPLVLSNVTSNLTVTANFSAQSFTVNFVAGVGGTLSGAATQIVPYGGTATAVTAEPNPGFQFSNWTGSGFTTTALNPLTVGNVTANHTISATFAITTFILTSSAGLNGTITPSGSVEVPPSGTTNFSITPAAYWQVCDVATNGASIGAVSSFIWSNVVADGTITATFAADQSARGTPHWWLAGHIHFRIQRGKKQVLKNGCVVSACLRRRVLQ
jgi:hypothetical protein